MRVATEPGARVISKLRRFWQTVPARITGSHVTTKSERFTGLSTKARFNPDDQLLLRMARAREELGDTPVKRLIESQPDTFVKPLDYDREPPPV